MGKRLGILGGTFDPVHLGHLQAARDTAAACDLDEVLLVLSARPPHKPQAEPAPIADRLQMLELATAGDPLFEVSDIEARRSGPSYMMDTLSALAEQHSDTRLALIMGYDAYTDIDTWYRAGDLLELADVIVTSRPDHARRAPTTPLKPPIAARNACCYDPDIGRYIHSSGHSLRYHQLTTGLSISASAVRAQRAAKQDITDLVGSRVADYIEKRQLYVTTL